MRSHTLRSRDIVIAADTGSVKRAPSSLRQRSACICLHGTGRKYASLARQQMCVQYKGLAHRLAMFVQVLHDRYIRLAIESRLGSPVHVSVDKQHVTAMGKGVSSTWSADSATVNLSANPLVDIVLFSTSPHQHRILVSGVVDEASVQGLHQVVVDGRHLVSTAMCDEHCVVGAEAIAKHLIAKHISIPALCCQPQAMRPYTEPQDCVHEFDMLLVRTENARARAKKVACKVQTVGSQAFRLFQRFNTTSTSKITSAFPEHSLEFAQSVCLAVGFLANATNTARSGVLLAHSLQQISVNAATAQHLLHLADLALRESQTSSAMRTADGASLPAPADPATDTPLACTTTPGTALKRGRLSILLETGTVYTTPFVTLDDDSRHMLATSNVYTRSETPMYMVFDRQRNAVLIADVAMHDCEVLGGGVRMYELSPSEQAVADMHFVNVSTSYHPELADRRQLLLNKACRAVIKPTPYTASILNMLRFEQGPMLALLAQQDL